MGICNCPSDPYPPAEDEFEPQHKLNSSLWDTPIRRYRIHPQICKAGSSMFFHLLTHIRWGRDLGTGIISVLSQFQLLSGRGVSILEVPLPRPKHNASKKAHIYKWHHLGIRWFQSMTIFLHAINGSIKIKELWTPQLVRESDSILMDDFCNAIKLSEWEWAQVKSVCL